MVTNVSVSNVWRLQQSRYGTPEGGLRGSVCPEGHVHFPPREVCPECAYLLFVEAEEMKQPELALRVELPAVALLVDA